MHKQSFSIQPFSPGIAALSSRARRPDGLRRDIVALLMRWQHRAADRAHLAALEPHRLADVGLTQTQRDREARKPFWVA